jgi:osmotically-inducible protein OsmY
MKCIAVFFAIFVLHLLSLPGDAVAQHLPATDSTPAVAAERASEPESASPGMSQGDIELTRDVRAAFTRDPYVERYAIRVAARNGQVALTGTVTSLFEKERAEQVAAGVPGVVAVVNNIHILPTASGKRD